MRRSTPKNNDSPGRQHSNLLHLKQLRLILLPATAENANETIYEQRKETVCFI